MDDLIAGYRRFRAGTWQAERSRFEALSRLGQRPRALIIACSDSRTDPQMVFNARPGELFVVRNVANLAPPYGPDDKPHGVSSAIEFAVRSLQVREIVVLGHAMCGGIQRAAQWRTGRSLGFRRPVGAHRRTGAGCARLPRQPEQRQSVCEHEAVRLSLDNLMTFPWIRDAVEAGHITLHGCFFDIRSGVLEHLGEDGVFHPIPD